MRLLVLVELQAHDACSQLLFEYLTAHFDKRIVHNSALSGRAWLQECLDGHPSRMRDNFGLSPVRPRSSCDSGRQYAFGLLHDELAKHADLVHSKRVSSEEQVSDGYGLS